MSTTRIIINGSRGQMGQALLRGAARNASLEVVATIDVGDSLSAAIANADVVIDFSAHEASVGVAEVCAAAGKALVLGTTGHLPEEKRLLQSIIAPIPVVWSSNYSTGVNTLFWLTRRAAEILGPGFDLEVVEMHHRLKRDAPSGTATTLLEILGEVRRVELEKELRHGRVGVPGPRTSNEIGIHALRGGDVVGDHTVIFAGMGERVELSHKASSRSTFADGALRAAQWVVGRPAGRYDMQDVLGLR